MLRQTQHEVEVNSVMTKTATVATEVEKNYKKNVVAHKLILRHNKELKCHDKKRLRRENKSC